MSLMVWGSRLAVLILYFNLVTLDPHAPQVYCSCVCVSPVRFFHTVTNWPRRPTHCLGVAIDDFKCFFFFFFFVKQPLRKPTGFASKLLAHLSAILLTLAGTQAYI